MEQSVIQLLQNDQRATAKQGTALLKSHSYTYSTDLEKTKYIHSLYSLRLKMANEAGVLYDGLAELVDNLAKLKTDEVRFNSFLLERGNDFVVITDPEATEIIGYLN